jgi:rhodanese-related sulfurtransferase
MLPHQVPTVSLDTIPPGALLLDVREDDEWAAGHIDGAVHVPMNLVPNRLALAPDEFASDVEIVVVCRVGGRSAQVAAWLNRQGVAAANLEGGMLTWAAAGRVMVSSDGTPPYVA